MNYKRIAALAFLLSVADLLIIPYQWLRCSMTHESYYCDFSAFGLFVYLIGIPALILLLTAAISFVKSKSSTPPSFVALALVTIFIVAIFLIPYLPTLLPRYETYNQWKSRMDQYYQDLEKEKTAKCLKYKQEAPSNPALVPPPECVE